MSATAPDLPVGVVGPARGSWTSAGNDAQWIVITDGRAQLCRTSGSYFARMLAKSLQRTEEPVIRAATLQALRDALQGIGVDVSRVSATTLDRNTLRAAIWWATAGKSGTPATRIWLPNALELPSVNVTLREGTAGISCTPLEPSRAAPAGGGGGSGGGSAPRPTSATTPPGGGSSGTGDAAMTALKVVVGAVVAAGAAGVGKVLWDRRQRERLQGERDAIPPPPPDRTEAEPEEEPAARRGRSSRVRLGTGSVVARVQARLAARDR